VTVGGLALTLAPLAAMGAEAGVASELRRAVPASVHMAVYAKRNSERAYQREYFREALQTARDERIGERVLKLITSHVPEDKLEKAQDAWEEVCEALEPINAKAIANAEEIVFAQKLVGPFNQQLVVFHLSSDEAENTERGLKQVFELAAEWGKDKLSVETDDVEDVEVTSLRFPEGANFEPCVARVDDLIFIGSGAELLSESLEQYQGDSGVSKFDDPRFKEALEHLPEGEDSVTFFDGRQLWKGLEGIGDFIREKAPNEEKAQRVAKLIDRIIDEVSILDYEVTVEYTEDGQNRAAAIGKLTADADEKLLGRALMQGEPFDDWQSWVPADAKGFSLSTGVNLHVLYDGILKIVREEFPESHDGLEKFEEMQDKIGVNIDRDILRNFSGECVSVTLATESDSGAKTPQGATALKCKDADRIRELLDRAVDALNELPAVRAQDLELVDSEELDGFQEIRANILGTAGVKPVIGFKDGWMIISSHEEAAKKLVEVRDGEADSIEDADTLDNFDIESDKPVYSVKYSDLGAGIRAAADFIDKASMMAPVFVGMAAAQADEKEMAAIQDAIGLLPSIAKVVRKFDFFEDRLCIVQEGPLPDTYVKHTATQIRQPEE
jgi:hypothetical protein